MDFVDDLQRVISLPAYPRRIVSLVPSITETLFALGVGERVVGVTDYCTHPPEEVARVTKVGGTKDPHLEVILQLAPDLVILNDEENRLEDAVDYFELAVHFAPESVAGWLELAATLATLERIQQAIAACQRAAKLAPASSPPPPRNSGRTAPIRASPVASTAASTPGMNCAAA